MATVVVIVIAVVIEVVTVIATVAPAAMRSKAPRRVSRLLMVPQHRPLLAICPVRFAPAES